MIANSADVTLNSTFQIQMQENVKANSWYCNFHLWANVLYFTMKLLSQKCSNFIYSTQYTSKVVPVQVMKAQSYGTHPRCKINGQRHVLAVSSLRKGLLVPHWTEDWVGPSASPRFGEEKNLLPFQESNQLSYPNSHTQSEKGVRASNARSTMHSSDLILQSFKMLLLINFELNIIHARPL